MIPSIPDTVIAHLQAANADFQKVLRTSACIANISTAPKDVLKAGTITMELIDLDSKVKELWPNKYEYLQPHTVLKLCLIWSVWSHEKQQPELHKEAISLYAHSVYLRFFRKYMSYCDDDRLQMAFQKVPKRSTHHKMKSHLGVVEYAIEQALLKPITTPPLVFSVYSIQIVNTLRQNMKVLASAYYNTHPDEKSKDYIFTDKLINYIDLAISFRSDDAMDAACKKMRVLSTSLSCMLDWAEKNKQEIISIWDSVISLHPMTVEDIDSPYWTQKYIKYIHMSKFGHRLNDIYKELNKTCYIRDAQQVWDAFIEYIHQKLKEEIHHDI